MKFTYLERLKEPTVQASTCRVMAIGCRLMQLGSSAGALVVRERQTEDVRWECWQWANGLCEDVKGARDKGEKNGEWW